jgi:sulfate/thiosulfate transport system substrate-binding protein
MTMTPSTTSSRRRLGALRPGARRALGASVLATLLGTTTFLAGAGAQSQTPASGNVSLVAYSTPAPAYDALIRAFQATKVGKSVSFSQSYGASGSQSKAVAAGQPADIVNFSLATDMERLVQKNLASSAWNSDPTTHGMVTDSVVVFVVPKGNPDRITKWSDLVKPGIRVFTPNPFSSGSARWNIMAAYGAQLKLGQTPAEAQSYLQSLLKNTVVQGTSAATEFQAFLADASSNKSDVFLDYEDDAIQAKRAGQKVDYVVPKQTLLIENPIAVTTNAQNPSAANAFVSYLFSTAGQQEWAKLGYRPVLPKVAAQYRSKFPHPAQLFTIEWLGGWDQIATQFFSTSSSAPGIVTSIEKSLGQATS